MHKIDMIVGVRPDFIQGAVLNQAFSAYDEALDLRIVHTGQHYDPELSQDLTEQLHLEPVYAFLPIESGSGMSQLASLMIAYEEQARLDPPDLVLILGNSNSALACSLVAARLGIKIAHVDSGIRSFKHNLLEEQNDQIIDKLATLLFTSSEESMINLIREGYDNQIIHEVGNVRADSVFMNLGYAEDSTILDRSGLREGGYLVLTLHHLPVMGETNFLVSLFSMLEDISERLMVYVILHPGSALQLEDIPELDLESTDNLQVVSSRTYQDMLKLIKYSALVLTDSQGIQEEASILGAQCLTLGNISNRPITMTRGTNTFAGFDVPEIQSKIMAILDGEIREGYPIDGWDGKASQRIAKIISEIL